MKKLLLLLIVLFCSKASCQKTFIDQPYLETTSKVDTLIAPDKIYLTIILLEKDSKGKMSVEELESKMVNKLQLLGIDIKKQLSLKDLSSNFKKYVLKKQDVMKAKQFSLLVYDANTAGKVIQKLEEENISNIMLDKTEYSKIEELKLVLKSKAVVKAKENAISLAKPLNQKIGKAIYISDMETNYINSLSGKVSGIAIRGYASLNESNYENEIPEIEFEKMKVEASVNVKFSLE
jgi:uncharacterized protein YggE